MVGRGRGRRSGRAGTTQHVRREVARLRREFSGHKVNRHITNPPVVNMRPFYPLRISLDMPDTGVEYSISVQDLRNRVAGQLGLSDQAKGILTMKLLSVHGWAYMYGSSTDRVAIQGEVSGLVPNIEDSAQQQTQNATINYPIIYRFQDFGTISRPAHFGYHYPLMMQQIPLTGSANFTVISVSNNSTNGTIHFSLLWSTGDLAAPQT